MKQLLILALAIATFIHTACAQAPQWQWARQPVVTVGSSWGGGNLATDPSGNIYMIGNFNGSYIIFGGDTIFNTADSVSFITRNCVFLVKYDPLGNLLWAKNVGPDGSSYNGIAVDAGGNVYAAAGRGIVKYGPSGNILWGISSNGANAVDICLDPQGNFYVTGWFEASSITFGSYVLYDSSGGNDFFIAKYDSAGRVLWAATNNGAAYGDNMGYHIATDMAGNVYLTGTFDDDSIDFGPAILYNSQLPLNPYSYVADVFTAKYDSSGRVLWVHGAGGVLDTYAKGICADTSGNAYIIGALNGGFIIFGSDTFFNPDSTYANGGVTGGINLFIAKYNTSGGLVWAKSSLGNGQASANDITHDDKGYIYITGNYYGDTMKLGNVTSTGQNGYNFYAAKLDSSGNGIWIIGIDSGSGANIATDAIGDVYVSGGFTGSTFTLGSIVLTDDSTYGGGFLAKLDTTLSTGIHDLSNENLKLYPNPTTDMLTINNLPPSATLTISDMTGRVYTTTLSGQHIDVSALPAGVYCLHIEDSGGSVVRKFVKE